MGDEGDKLPLRHWREDLGVALAAGVAASMLGFWYDGWGFGMERAWPVAALVATTATFVGLRLYAARAS